MLHLRATQSPDRRRRGKLRREKEKGEPELKGRPELSRKLPFVQHPPTKGAMFLDQQRLGKNHEIIMIDLLDFTQALVLESGCLKLSLYQEST